MRRFIFLPVLLKLLVISCKSPSHHSVNSDPDASSSAPEAEPLSDVLQAPDPSFGLVPLNPKFGQPIPKQEEDGHALGWVEPPVDIGDFLRKEYQQPSPSALNPAGADVLVRGSDLPPQYDSRSVGKVSGIRNQGQAGTCWAHAAIASLEAVDGPLAQPDYSENHMAKNNGFDLGVNQGGNFSMAAAYLVRWSGPITEADDPYNELGPSRGLNLPVRKHVQGYNMFLHDKSSISSLMPVKRAIKDYGTVFTTIFWDNSYYRADTASFFNNNNANANHAVALVGWDDQYPASNFKQMPKWNGAWLVKNSWGTAFGQEGFFWVSYADLSLGLAGDSMFEPSEETNNYTKIYEYDSFGHVRNSYMTEAKQKIRLANRFVTQDDGSIAAVSFYGNGPFETYQVSIYLSPTSTPDSGKLVWTTHVDAPYFGYRTVKVDPTVPITAGTSFTVVVEKSPKKFLYTLVPVESPISGYSSKATAAPGQSFYSNDDGSWYDLTSQSGMASANFLIKAYAKGKGPRLTESRPTQGIENIDVIDPIFLRFDKHVKQGSRFNSISLNGSAVTAAVDGDKLVITPSQPLTWGSSYKLIVPQGAVKDDSGVSSEMVELSFSTSKTPKINLLSIIPENKAIKVAPDQVFSLTFDVPISGGRNLSDISISNAKVSSTIANRILGFKSREPLLYRNTYTVSVPEGAVKGPGGSVNRAASFSFVTMDPPPLMSKALSPVNNQTNVPLRTNVEITYNLSIKPGDLSTIGFTTSEGQAVDFTTKWRGSTLTLIPKGNLNRNTVYKVKVPSAAVLSAPYSDKAAEEISIVFTTSRKS